MYKDKRFLLFDLDGTLTDPFFGITRCVRHALSSVGIREDDLHRLTPFIGPPLADSFRDFYGLRPAEVEKAIAAYHDRFVEKGWLENEVYPGIPELLRSQRDMGRRLFVATSKPQELAERILDHFGLAPYFERICGALDGPGGGSKAAVIGRLLRDAPVDRPDAALMIGDRRFDVEGARENGVEALGVLYGYGTREEFLSCGATRTAATVDELRDLLAE